MVRAAIPSPIARRAPGLPKRSGALLFGRFSARGYGQHTDGPETRRQTAPSSETKGSRSMEGGSLSFRRPLPQCLRSPRRGLRSSRGRAPDLLRTDRERQGFTVGQVAWRLGIKPQECRELEAGERFPDFTTLGRMCKLYGWPQTFLKSRSDRAAT